MFENKKVSEIYEEVLTLGSLFSVMQKDFPGRSPLNMAYELINYQKTKINYD